MYRKILLGGVAAAVIVGAGGTALAVTGSSTTAGTPSASSSSSRPSSSSSSKKADAKKKHPFLRRLEHGQFVTRGKGGQAVTHDLIKGTVTAVSSTSITVQATDKKSETFAVTKDTKVRVRKDGKGSASTVASVAKGDHVMVSGTGTSTFTAGAIVDAKG
jgi:hypothetical protein